MKQSFKNHGENGFTLVELLVSLLISGILIFTVMSVFLMSQKLYVQGEGISYKQKSITNVETELQNNLSTATDVWLFNSIVSTNDIAKSADFIIGFDDKGQCVQKIYNETKTDFDTYPIDQIKDLVLKVTQEASSEKKNMNYELIPKNSMSTLSGGIVLNNSRGLNLDNKFVVNDINGISLETKQPLFLVVKRAVE